MKCKICGKEAGEGEFCPSHFKAHRNVEESYAIWKKALKIRWDEYLRKIKENPLTGIWAKEAACYLTSKEELENVKEI